ncbi:MAG: nitrite reductase (NADH) small subunit [Gammaproteobacteria bacterium]|jgi:nitrite reductase (NADH) small subunit
MNEATFEWVDIGALREIPRRGSRQVKVNNYAIAIFRTADDRIYAIEDRCPHLGGPLSQGIVHGTAVTCPLHSWVISVESGKVLGSDTDCVRTIPVRKDNGRILLRFPFYSEQAA